MTADTSREAVEIIAANAETLAIALGKTGCESTAAAWRKASETLLALLNRAESAEYGQGQACARVDELEREIQSLDKALKSAEGERDALSETARHYARYQRIAEQQAEAAEAELAKLRS